MRYERDRKSPNRRCAHQTSGAEWREVNRHRSTTNRPGQLCPIHLQIKPGTNVPLLNAIARVIVEEKLFDPSVRNDTLPVGTNSANSSDYLRRKTWRPLRCQSQLDPSGRATLRNHNTSDVLSWSRPHRTRPGTESVMGRESCATHWEHRQARRGVNPLRGQNNVQGPAHMGCEPGMLTGRLPSTNGERFETVWNRQSRSPGLNLLQMMDAANEAN